MDDIRCFWLTPVPRALVSYRRYTFNGGCERGSYGHDASVSVGEVPLPLEEMGRGGAADARARLDARWPTACSRCGHVFAAGDEWQVNVVRMHSRSDGGPDTTIGGAPAGAMWDADWMGRSFRGPDGRCLVVRTPGGDWTVDGKSSNGPGWTRTGAVPDVTATPSIIAGGYHGWLTRGFLVSC